MAMWIGNCLLSCCNRCEVGIGEASAKPEIAGDHWLRQRAISEWEQTVSSTRDAVTTATQGQDTCHWLRARRDWGGDPITPRAGPASACSPWGL